MKKNIKTKHKKYTYCFSPIFLDKERWHTGQWWVEDIRSAQYALCSKLFDFSRNKLFRPKWISNDILEVYVPGARGSGDHVATYRVTKL
jgi:hypothetical protein